MYHMVIVMYNILFICIGKVFMNGIETSTKLPVLKRGTKLTFESEQLSDNKIRVTIIASDKSIGLDWSVDQSINPKQSNSSVLYFASKLSYNWKVSVE